MPNFFHGKYIVEQYGTSVQIGADLWDTGSHQMTDLHLSYFGHILGFTKPFQDEESANFAFEEVANYLQSTIS